MQYDMVLQYLQYTLLPKSTANAMVMAPLKTWTQQVKLAFVFSAFVLLLSNVT